MDAGRLPARLGGVVLDAVGTLIEATPSVTEAYAAAALRQGIGLDRAVVRERFRRSFLADESRERDGSLETDEASEHRRWRALVAEVLPELPDPDRGFVELWDHFGQPHAWRCFPDVGPFLARLARAGVPVRVASNFDARLRSVVAGLPELAGLGECLSISSEVGHRKPSGAFYRGVLDAIGTDPTATLWIGDDAVNDVDGPRRAGFPAVLIDRDGRAGDGGGRLVLPDLTALADRLTGAGALPG